MIAMRTTDGAASGPAPTRASGFLPLVSVLIMTGEITLCDHFLSAPRSSLKFSKNLVGL